MMFLLRQIFHKFPYILILGFCTITANQDALHEMPWDYLCSISNSYAHQVNQRIYQNKKSIRWGAISVQLFGVGKLFDIADAKKPRPSAVWPFASALASLVLLCDACGDYVWQQAGDVLVIPPELEYLKNCELLHVRSVKQKGDNCGWYAVFNAAAINELLENDAQITSDAIAREVKTLENYVRCHPSEVMGHGNEHNLFGTLIDPEFKKLATFVGLPQLDVALLTGSYDVHYITNEQVNLQNHGWRTYIEDESYFQYDLTVENFLKCISFQQVGKVCVAHMVLLTPFDLGEMQHAVYLCIIKRDGKKPLLIYMDSNNWLLGECRNQYATPFFVSKLVRELDRYIVQIL